MKSLTIAISIATLISAPPTAFSQSNQPVTRAQVRTELIQLENAGWKPTVGRDPHYPDDIQAAEARVAAQNNAERSVDSSYGATEGGTSQSGQGTNTGASSYRLRYGMSSIETKHETRFTRID